MSNILTIPLSSAIYFSDGSAGDSTIPELSGNSIVLQFDDNAGLELISYNTSSTSRFSVDGSAGRLFNVTDSLTGTIFSVNDVAGLPIIEVISDETADVVKMGTIGTNAFVLSSDKLGLGTDNPTTTLDVVGEIKATVYSGGLPETFIISLTPPNGDAATGTDVESFSAPYGFTITSVTAHARSAPIGQALTIDVNNNGTSILSAVINIADGATTSTGGTISSASVSEGDIISFDFDQVGSTNAGSGIKITIKGTRS